MFDNFVDDDEILYRRIPGGKKLYTFKTDGTIEISSQAFADREYRISVERALLCHNDPKHTLGNERGGVVSLVTKDVRNVDSLVRNDRKGNVIQQFKIDVEPVPLPGNSAHAEIFALPEFTDADNKRAFHRLCQRLARLAEARPWEISPDSQ